MDGIFVKKITLTQFRNYAAARILLPDAAPVVLAGLNGAGKTNLLEAVSLLSPGRGLRGASAQDMQNRDATAAEPWAIAAEIETEHGAVRIGTGRDPDGTRRIVRINGQTAGSQAALGDHVAVLWLTPQMDRLFLSSPSDRRRFLDRLVCGFDPAHTGRVSRYEKSLRERSALLRDTWRKPDPAWLSSLEAALAETGVAIAASRREMVDRLRRAAHRVTDDPVFATPAMRVAGWPDDVVGDGPAVEIEEEFRDRLKDSRGRDAETGGAAAGPHRSDFLVRHAGHDMPADQCSTGEQKALLLAITLAHARLIRAERGFAPLLLLDEVAAHLDVSRRAALLDRIADTGSQAWLTGTDAALFAPVAGQGHFFTVDEGRIEPGVAKAA